MPTTVIWTAWRRRRKLVCSGSVFSSFLTKTGLEREKKEVEKKKRCNTNLYFIANELGTRISRRRDNEVLV